ncbi:hypothetical protein [Ectothiorhodospira shaposhnikovii]|uniref:hypothetical protein n=1 Tax=Ectothiorhodospira shaposhnikovii TaxID=1054 RepID=UPI0039A18937
MPSSSACVGRWSFIQDKIAYRGKNGQTAGREPEQLLRAEDDEDRLSGTSWTLEEDIFDQVTESGFKLHLIELLDDFIAHRGQCNELPKKEGIVRFGDGVLSIEWLPDGSTHLSDHLSTE